MNIAGKLREDPLGSLLYKFFTGRMETHEKEDELCRMLWSSVCHYRQTGRFSMAVIACPQYSQDYREVLGGASVTACRAVSFFRELKLRLGRHISYGAGTQFRVLLFDREHRQFDLMGIPVEEAGLLMDSSVREIRRLLRKTGVLPDAFAADRLVGSEGESEWLRLFGLASDALRLGKLKSGEPFDQPDKVLEGLTAFYTKVMNTSDRNEHRRMFESEEGPGYLATGHFVRKRLGSHAILVDVGSHPGLARMTMWQLPEEELLELPAVIRIRDPHRLDK